MRQGVAIFVATVVVAASLPSLREYDDKFYDLLSKAKIAVTPSKKGKSSKLDPPALTGIDLSNMDDRRGEVTAPAHGDRNADLLLDPHYQRAAMHLLRRGQVHEGAVVMTEVKTGRVLAWASHNQGRRRDTCVEASAPSASVFKVVTGSALVEQGASINRKYCYPGGGHKGITMRMLEPDQRRDKYCASLGMAMGRSINVVFGRLALKYLDDEKLTAAARRMGYGLQIPFDVPVQVSKIKLPEEDLEFAQSAAGFWHTYLSPFQGANLALTLANRGEMIRQFIVKRVVDGAGDEVYRWPGKRQVFKRVLNERTAWAVTRMMEQTVKNGTSFKTFHDRAGRPFLPDIHVAGKTGTLAKKKPDTLYTWWVGFAPARKPEVALSVLVVNRGAWHVKGTHVAADMLRVYFADKGRSGVRRPPGIHARKVSPKPKRSEKKALQKALPTKTAHLPKKVVSR
jgi:penicillin-binding protein A